MTVALANNFEGGTALALITAANSGGASGNAFNSVSSGIAGIPRYGTAQVHSGTRSMEIAQGASFANSAGSGTWTFAAEPRLYFRAYVWFPPTMSSNDIQLLAVGGMMFSAYATTTSSAARWSTGGGSGIGGVGAVTGGPKPGAWFRVEAMLDSANNLVQARIFSSAIESDLPTSDSGPGTPVSTSVGTINSITIGSLLGFNNPPGPFQNASMFLDDLAVSTAGWPGPSGAVDRSLPGVAGVRDRLATRVEVIPNQPSPARMAGGGISLYQK